ncbi:uncharacterized protein LOC114841142, partial [Diachasma alloeum]|uniref:uncharacterized protein LOC114841142 n=1 Tax=Diachasma alloeum TaxID=454923 RepID=UPI0010FBBC45
FAGAGARQNDEPTSLVFCREKASVTGISVEEHFEINVVPLTIGLTKFFNTMLKFCFPERDPDGIEEPLAAQRDSSFYVPIENKLLIHIKISEDVRDSVLVILSQAVKQKLQIQPKGPQEENKARLLLVSSMQAFKCEY